MQVEVGLFELEPATLEPGEVKHVAEDAEQAARRATERVGIAGLRGIERARQQQLRNRHDRLHRGAQFMPNHGHEVKLGLVRRFGRFARRALGRKRIDKALDLRKQIVRLKVLGSHRFLSQPSLLDRPQHRRDHLKLGLGGGPEKYGKSVFKQPARRAEGRHS